MSYPEISDISGERSKLSSWELVPSLEDKLLLLTARHYISATNTDAASFIQMLFDLSSQAQDEFSEAITSLMQQGSDIRPIMSNTV